MKIAFDAIALLSATSKNRGIGNYTLDLFSTMLKQDEKNEYYFFNVLEDTDYFQKEVEKGKLVEAAPFYKNKERFFALPDMGAIYGELIRAFIRKHKIDVFMITSPFDGNYPTYQKEWFEGTRVAVIVYDIIPYVMQDRYFPREGDMVWYLERLEQLKWADQLLVISQSVKDDLIQYLHLPSDNIHVIWGAPGQEFQVRDVSPAYKEALCKKFRINSPFVMCTGGDDERKNIAGLITAFGKLPKELIQTYQLVIVCKLQKAAVKRYTELSEKCGLKGRVVLTNFVDDEELVALYNLASLVAFPSVYEGFGLPVVEAWACGTPVVTSNNSSLGQIGEGAAELVDPHDTDDIARGLAAALQPEKLEELTRLGRQKLPMFQWTKVARDTVAFMEQLQPVKSRNDDLKAKIAFFTPLPPLQSGISDYSVDVIGALSQYFDIDVYVDSGYKVNCELPENVACKVHTQYPKNRAEYQHTVFQVGNFEYHSYMWEYIIKYGGTVVLHDYNLHGVVQFKIMAHDKDILRYRKILLDDYDAKEVESYIASVKKGGPMKIHAMAVNSFLVNYADKIIVHSLGAKQKLLEKDISRDVTCIPHYVKIEPLVDSRAAKAALQIPEDEFVFAAFGHVHDTKRALPIVKAFARLQAEHPNAKLVFVGKLDEGLAPRFKSLVEALGVTDQVTVTGYASLEDFRQYIDATDVCLNLRWPYNGETSGSLMRILGKGKCVVVNNIGSFGEIPDEACVKLPSVETLSEKQEIDNIYKVMQDLFVHQDTRHQLEKAARKYAEENLDLPIIAKQYCNVILKKPQRFVTEELLFRLKRDMAQNRFHRDEIQKMAKMLTFIKTEKLS